jgi:hypothetical protein
MPFGEGNRKTASSPGGMIEMHHRPRPTDEGKGTSLLSPIPTTQGHRAHSALKTGAQSPSQADKHPVTNYWFTAGREWELWWEDLLWDTAQRKLGLVKGGTNPARNSCKSVPTLSPRQRNLKLVAYWGNHGCNRSQTQFTTITLKA